MPFSLIRQGIPQNYIQPTVQTSAQTPGTPASSQCNWYVFSKGIDQSARDKISMVVISNACI